MIWSQDIKPDMRFIFGGITYTAQSVQYISGYHGRYRVTALADGARKPITITLWAGEEIKKAD